VIHPFPGGAFDLGALPTSLSLFLRRACSTPSLLGMMIWLIALTRARPSNSMRFWCAVGGGAVAGGLAGRAPSVVAGPVS
jgi:hypothetical protein